MSLEANYNLTLLINVGLLLYIGFNVFSWKILRTWLAANNRYSDFVYMYKHGGRKQIAKAYLSIYLNRALASIGSLIALLTIGVIDSLPIIIMGSLVFLEWIANTAPDPGFIWRSKWIAAIKFGLYILLALTYILQ